MVMAPKGRVSRVLTRFEMMSFSVSTEGPKSLLLVFFSLEKQRLKI